MESMIAQADHAVDRIGGRQRQLRAQNGRRASAARRYRPRYWRLRPIDPRRRPTPDQAVSDRPSASSLFCSARGAEVAVAVEGVLDFRAEAFRQPFRGDRELRRAPVGLAGIARELAGGFGRPGGRRVDAGRRRVGRFLRALQQGIALQLFLDESRQFDARILQQLDRLQQLRRHDQGLALPKQHFGG